jgi:hypothetical protein
VTLDWIWCGLSLLIAIAVWARAVYVKKVLVFVAALFVLLLSILMSPEPTITYSVAYYLDHPIDRTVMLNRCNDRLSGVPDCINATEAHVLSLGGWGEARSNSTTRAKN